MHTEQNVSNPLFPNKKKLLSFSFYWSLVFSPIIFLVSLLNFTPFHTLFLLIFGEQPDTFEKYTEAIISTVLQSVILIIITYFSLKKIDSERKWKITHRLLGLFFVSIIIPSLVSIVLLLIFAIIEGGDGVGFAFLYASAYAVYTLLSFLPIVFFSWLIYLWLTKKKTYVVVILLFIAGILSWYTFSQALILGCPKSDAQCLARRAISTHDQKKCLEAELPRQCYEEFAALENNSTACDSIPQQYKVDCLNIIADLKAYNNKDPEACDAITCSDTKDYEGKSCRNDKQNCYARTYTLLALHTGDTTHCDKAASYHDQEWLTTPESFISQDRCYTLTAIKKHDSNICNKLPSSKDKERCFADFNQCILEPPVQTYNVRPGVPYILSCIEKTK